MRFTRLFTLLFLAATLTVFTGCNKDDDEAQGPAELIDPADANALTGVLIVPDGTDRLDGTPPGTTSTPTTPTVENFVDLFTAANGATVPLAFQYGNVDDNLGGCYVQIAGSDTYFTVPYDQTAGNSGQLQLPIGIPTNVDEGAFDVNFCVYDTDGQVSNVTSTTVNVLRLGTGSVQVTLSWNDDTDQDLYVTGPDGNVISYTNTISDNGGALDRDDTNGYGPENIFWTENAPDGTYSVSVDAFSFQSEPTTFYLNVNGPEDSRRFTGTTVEGNTVEVVTFTKSGDRLTF